MRVRVPARAPDALQRLAHRPLRRGPRLNAAPRVALGWIAWCALAGATGVVLSCGGATRVDVLAGYGGPLAMAVAIGLAQALALPGSPRRRVMWAVLTSLGVGVAFFVGVVSGLAVFVALSAAMLVLALPAASNAVGTVIGVVFGAFVGGAVVGTFQAVLVDRPRRWIVLSAIGGMVVLPATLMLVIGPNPQACASEPAAVAVTALCGAVYGAITVGSIAPPER